MRTSSERNGTVPIACNLDALTPEQRLCCPFFGFRLEVANEGGAARLGLTGRPGVKEFVEAELGL